MISKDSLQVLHTNADHNLKTLIAENPPDIIIINEVLPKSKSGLTAKSSDILNKNSLAVKSARPIRSSIVTSDKRPKTLISTKAKKVPYIKYAE